MLASATESSTFSTYSLASLTIVSNRLASMTLLTLFGYVPLIGVHIHLFCIATHLYLHPTHFFFFLHQLTTVQLLRSVA